MLSPPASRLKAGEVLTHPWLSEQDSNDDKPLSLNYQSLKHFTQSQKFKKITMLTLAAGMSEEEISELSTQFDKLDKNGDGVLTFEEMQAGLL
jgi:calcium-dependent protein kinase